MFTNVKPEKTIYVCSSLYFRDIAYAKMAGTARYIAM